MKILKCWNKGSPFVQATLASKDEALAVKSNFSSIYGCSVGYVGKSHVIFSGHAAVEFLKFHGQPLGDFGGWVPKNDSRKFHRLPDTIFVEEAKKHVARSQWKRHANGHYQHVTKHRRHLLEACTAHMESPGSPFSTGYQVYAYESVKTVYVGLTCTPKRRHRDHKLKGPVSSMTAPVLTIVREGLMPTAAAALEKKTIADYGANGWTVLNRHKGGSTGQIRIKYAFESILCAAAVGTKKQFLDSYPAMFQSAVRYGWMQRLEKRLNWPRHSDHWTFEECLLSASPHRYVTDWLKANKNAYLSAWRKGWLPKIKSAAGLMRRPAPSVLSSPVVIEH